ncbi:hypothetical protein YC2023_060015 [Brassica napus]
MANFNLASLPPSIIHKILSKVATTSIRDFVGREDYFYKSANLIFLNDWLDKVNDVRIFRLKCYQLGNPEAIYLRGMYEYFILHLLDEGREKNHLAGERGCLLAKYVYGMMNLAFSVDHRGVKWAGRPMVAHVHIQTGLIWTNPFFPLVFIGQNVEDH